MEGAPNNKPVLPKPKPQNFSVVKKHCAKCGRTNHDTIECRVGTNRCFWYGDSNHIISNCPVRLSSQHKGPSSILKGTKAATPVANRSVGKAYVINRKQAHEAATVVTGTLIFNSVPLIVLFQGNTFFYFVKCGILDWISIT